MKYSIGIDLGASYIKAGFVDEEYNIVTRKQIKTPKKYEDILNEIKDLIEENDRVTDIGIGIPGLVNEEGIILFCDNIDIINKDLKRDIKESINYNISIENDADCALIGEYLNGAAKGCDNVLMFTLGTGIGSSVLMNGKMIMGTELGHMTICLGGNGCACGSRGCLEAYCKSKMLGDDVSKTMEMNNRSSKKMVDDYIKALTAGIRNGILAYDPELVILGGGISNYGDILIDLINEEMKNYGYDYRQGKAKIKKASLLNDAGIIGASALNLFKC